MAERRRVFLHRVRGLATGVEWRVTKFTAAVPPKYVCSLCRLISKQSVSLPCGHALCESCVSGSVSDGNGMCPLDEEPFVAGECQRIHLPDTAMNKFKACCWNEAHGCTFEGMLPAVLEHYEQQCTFHATTCPRCDDSVLQQDLPRHYMAGCCSEATASVASSQTPERSAALSVREVASALEELKALIGDPYGDRLPARQSQINELLERTRNHSQRFDEIAGALRETEQRLKDWMTQTCSRGGLLPVGPQRSLEGEQVETRQARSARRTDNDRWGIRHHDSWERWET